MNNSGEKSAQWYDDVFDAHDHWKAHYSQSHYYFIWAVIADRLLTGQVESILDIGCGAGQLACMLRDKGIKKYLGIDFAEKRIDHAKSICPQFNFANVDVYETDLFEQFDYKGVVCTEFLEHVDKDIEVIQRLKNGIRFIGTVPNFPFESHVRYFQHPQQVFDRYKECFSALRVDAFLANPNGTVFYLIDGIVK